MESNGKTGCIAPLAFLRRMLERGLIRPNIVVWFAACANHERESFRDMVDGVRTFCEKHRIYVIVHARKIPDEYDYLSQALKMADGLARCEPKDENTTERLNQLSVWMQHTFTQPGALECLAITIVHPMGVLPVQWSRDGAQRAIRIYDVGLLRDRRVDTAMGIINGGDDLYWQRKHTIAKIDEAYYRFDADGAWHMSFDFNPKLSTDFLKQCDADICRFSEPSLDPLIASSDTRNMVDLARLWSLVRLELCKRIPETGDLRRAFAAVDSDNQHKLGFMEFSLTTEDDFKRYAARRAHISDLGRTVQLCLVNSRPFKVLFARVMRWLLYDIQQRIRQLVSIRNAVSIRDDTEFDSTFLRYTASRVAAKSHNTDVATIAAAAVGAAAADAKRAGIADVAVVPAAAAAAADVVVAAADAADAAAAMGSPASPPISALTVEDCVNVPAQVRRLRRWLIANQAGLVGKYSTELDDYLWRAGVRSHNAKGDAFKCKQVPLMIEDVKGERRVICARALQHCDNCNHLVE
jgi:hypothetical protein